jgi:hypothetical protein
LVLHLTFTGDVPLVDSAPRPNSYTLDQFTV